MHALYSALHLAEEVDGVQLILIPDISDVRHDLTPSLMDRIVRATSGQVVQLPITPVL